MNLRCIVLHRDEDILRSMAPESVGARSIEECSVECMEMTGSQAPRLPGSHTLGSRYNALDVRTITVSTSSQVSRHMQPQIRTLPWQVDKRDMSAIHGHGRNSLVHSEVRSLRMHAVVGISSPLASWYAAVKMSLVVCTRYAYLNTHIGADQTLRSPTPLHLASLLSSLK
jgi:hypothetical protein